MFTIGSHEVRVCDDGWTVETIDGKLAAHWEHTLAITADGPRILTANDVSRRDGLGGPAGRRLSKAA